MLTPERKIEVVRESTWVRRIEVSIMMSIWIMVYKGMLSNPRPTSSGWKETEKNKTRASISMAKVFNLTKARMQV